MTLNAFIYELWSLDESLCALKAKTELSQQYFPRAGVAIKAVFHHNPTTLRRFLKNEPI